MPLARIVTSTPEQVSAAVDHLRARGFDVEVVDPGQAGADGADVVIDAEGRTFQEALSLAVEASQPKPRRVIAYDLTGRPVEYASEEEEEPQPERKSLWSRVSATLHEVGENTRLSLGHLREWVQEGRESIAEKRAERERKRTERASVITQAGAEAESQRQGQAMAKQARLAAERALRERQDAQERPSQQTELARQHQEELERERLRAEELRREQAERARQRALAEQRRQEEERRQALAEERRRQDEERARQEALAQERRRQEQHAAEVAQLARQRQLDEEQRQAAARALQAKADAAREATSVVTPAGSKRQRPAAVAAGRSVGRDGDLRKAMMAAAVIALLATLGYAAYINRRAPAPLSNRDLVRSQGISQPVPFGAATATPTQPASPPLHPHAVLPQGSAEPPATATQAAPAPKPRLKRQSTRAQDDDVAEDEVIVHRAHPPSGTPVAKGSGVKRYSDLEQ